MFCLTKKGTRLAMYIWLLIFFVDHSCQKKSIFQQTAILPVGFICQLWQYIMKRSMFFGKLFYYLALRFPSLHMQHHFKKSCLKNIRKHVKSFPHPSKILDGLMRKKEQIILSAIEFSKGIPCICNVYYRSLLFGGTGSQY